jgi:hypothetical protein
MEKITLTQWEMAMISYVLQQSLSHNNDWSHDTLKQVESLANRFENAEKVVVEVK